MPPDAVLFDFHRTLVVAGSLPAWLDQAAGEAGEAVDHERVLPVLREVWVRAGRRYPDTAWDLDPQLHRRVFEEVLTEDAACPPAVARALYDLMPRQWVAVPGAVELLGALASSGVRVGLLSNTALDVRPRLADLGLLPHLDAVVLSFEEGLIKPDRRLFERAAARLGADPRDCVYVGDSPVSDGGAVDAGMTCILVPVVDDTPRLGQAARLLGVPVAAG